MKISFCEGRRGRMATREGGARKDKGKRSAMEGRGKRWRERTRENGTQRRGKGNTGNGKKVERRREQLAS
ncbi:hypothetical protein ACOSP7_021060 [Xanthoceras sorbifolium]